MDNVGYESCTSLREIEHILDGAGNGSELYGRKAGERSINQAAVVDGAQLVHQEVGFLAEFALGRDANPERVRVIHQLGREGNDERRGVLYIQ